MSIQLTRTIEWLLLPPGLIILLLLLAIYFWNSRQQDSFRNRKPNILWLTLLLLYGMSINVSANYLTSALERSDLYPPLTIEQIKNSDAQAIIILGHGRYHSAPEYGDEDTLNTGGLARARYGAKLHRQTGIPILTSGGTPYQHDTISEAVIMKKVLEEEFKVPVRWTEEKSRNTYENALYSSIILEREGIKRALMVTHSRDITRALWAFNKTGKLQIIPAPTLFSKFPAETEMLDWIPNPYALGKSATALHEHLGLLWYRGKNILPLFLL